jgi:hypothetical protein
MMRKSYYAVLGFVLLIMVSCSSSPGIQYTVTITTIVPIAGSPANYCTYNFNPGTGPVPPRLYFVNTCDKYTVGQVITISMNPNGSN